MQITINTGEMSARDAAGLIALLGLQFPDALSELEAAGLRIAGISDGVNVTDAANAAEAFTAGPSAEAAFAAAPVPPVAADGAPIPPVVTTPEPSAGVAANAPASAAKPPAGNSVPAAAAPAGGDLDADGIPWDGRIHSEGHAKTKDGKWRLKRGVDEATRTKITGELKAAMGAAPAPVSVPVAPAAPPASEPVSVAPIAEPAPSPEPAAPPPPAPVVEAPAAAAAPIPPAAPAEPAAPAPPTGPQAFAALMKKITAAQNGGQISAADVAAIVQGSGLSSVRDFLTRPDLIPAFEETFDAYVSAAA